MKDIIIGLDGNAIDLSKISSISNIIESEDDYEEIEFMFYIYPMDIIIKDKNKKELEKKREWLLNLWKDGKTFFQYIK